VRVHGKLITMDNLEIFDKDGKQLNIADVIYGFIEERAKISNKDIEDVFIGVDVGFPKGKPIWIYTTESVDNGYDAIDLHDFGSPLKTSF
jgi:hypothetical protein